LDDASGQEGDAQAESEIKLAQKEFNEDEYHSDEEQKKTEEAATTTREFIEEDEEESIPLERQDEWRTRSKHIFILSEAGKPIYSL
jgi:hypothetical protein